MPDYCGGATSVKYELLMTYPDTEVVYHGKDTSCRIHGLQPGRAYRFQVRALNDAGVSISCAFFTVHCYPESSSKNELTHVFEFLLGQHYCKQLAIN